MTIKIFLGVMGSGKSFRSQQLVDQGYNKVSVADPMRETLWKILGWEPQNDKEYQDFKNSKLISGSKIWVEGIVDYPVSGRKMLQNIGETFKDLFGRDYWSELWYYNVRQSTIKDAVCDDLRFPEEVNEALQLLGDGYQVQFIFCNYNSDRYNPSNTHISERYAQMLLALNKYQDGDVIDIEDLKTINNKFYE